MRTGFVVAGAGLLTLASSLVITPIANATAPPPKLRITSNTTAVAGTTVEFEADCYGTPSRVTSPGLVAPVALEAKASPVFVGQGRAGARSGHFTASFTCSASSDLPAASGTATVEFTVTCSSPAASNPANPRTPTVVPPLQSPTVVQPPAPAVAKPPASPTVANPPTSPTVAAPPPTSLPTSRPTVLPTGPSATSVERPSTAAPKTPASCAAGQPPQVTITPKGAPETGDGSTATS